MLFAVFLNWVWFLFLVLNVNCDFYIWGFCVLVSYCLSSPLAIPLPKLRATPSWSTRMREEERGRDLGGEEEGWRRELGGGRWGRSEGEGGGGGGERERWREEKEFC